MSYVNALNPVGSAVRTPGSLRYGMNSSTSRNARFISSCFSAEISKTPSPSAASGLKMLTVPSGVISTVPGGILTTSVATPASSTLADVSTK